jgi:putative CocE/NonD family hydrolase
MIEVTGLPKLILHVSSSARDTDFCGKLLDVFPDGRAISIGDGGIRARYRNSWEPEYLSPSEKYEIEIPLEYISYAFLPGHRIRIEVTSSNFPKFDFNHNTGKRPAEDIDLVVANNCVYHEASMQSRLVLPVINDTEQ